MYMRCRDGEVKMNTPVVDKDGNIIGGLIVFSGEGERSDFHRASIAPISVCCLKPGADIPNSSATIVNVHFEHKKIISKRPDRKPYVLKVVVADRPELLMRVAGYRTLPEIFGEELPGYDFTERPWRTHTHRLGIIGG